MEAQETVVAAESESIMRVTSVTVGRLMRATPLWFVEASGVTPTSGWTDVRLETRHHRLPPAEGIQDVDFLASPPGGLSLPVVTSVTAPPLFLDRPPAWLAGIRIHAADNALMRRIALRKAVLLELDLDSASNPSPAGTAAGRFDAPSVEYDSAEEAGNAGRASGEDSHIFDLVHVAGWPELMTLPELRQFSVFGNIVAVQVPTSYLRRVRTVLEAEICWPTGIDLRRPVEEASCQALADGMFAGAVCGDVGATAAALQVYLRICLAATVGEPATAIRVGLRRHRICGTWQKI